MDGFLVSSKLHGNYNCYYDGRSEWRRLGALDKAANVIRLCSDYRHGSIVDIGAGEGSVLSRLSELRFGKRYYALDISESGMEVISERKIANLSEATVFDGYSIPYADNKFDLAIMSHVVEHVEYPRRLLYEASRVARFVFIEVPLEDTLSLPDNFVFDSVGHINFYSPITFRRLVQTCDLEVLNQLVTNKSRRLYQYNSRYMGLLKKGLD